MRGRKPLSLLLAIALIVVAGAGAPRPRPGPAARPAASRLGPEIPPELRNTRTVALTFDDGPSRYTPQILAVLRRHGISATFCMLGDSAARLPAVARQVAREGHQICNHSRDHRDFARLTPRQARAEVTAGQRQIHAATGVTPRIFRFPYGSSDRAARTIVTGYGLRIVGWDVDPNDWKRPPSRALTARVVSRVRPGSVVLMHDGGGDRSHTAASLDATIRRLEAKGYRFATA